MASSITQGLNAPTEASEESPMNTINTTPLVDVMLVLLIVFMITVPVITASVPLELPEVYNQPTQTKPENVNIAVNREGQIFWNTAPLTMDELRERLRTVAPMEPQPEVHVRADQRTRYEHVGRVIVTAQRSGILKVGFITEPEPGGARR